MAETWAVKIEEEEKQNLLTQNLYRLAQKMMEILIVWNILIGNSADT